jgi:hypothetical protein
MTTKQPTPDMTTKLAAVHAATAKLDDKHFVWIIDAAIEHFSSAAKKTEVEIIRYKLQPELPIFTRYGKDRGRDLQGTTRERELPRVRASLDEQYAILEFLQALKDVEVLRNAEAFAAGLRDSGFFGGARRRRDGRGTRQ